MKQKYVVNLINVSDEDKELFGFMIGGALAGGESEEPGHVGHGRWHWTPFSNYYIGTDIHDITFKQFRNINSHEVMHNLGVGDAYPIKNDAGEIVEIRDKFGLTKGQGDDIMYSGYNNPQISNVHIYMMLEAHRTQEFMEYNDPKLEQFKGRVVYSNIGGIR